MNATNPINEDKTSGVNNSYWADSVAPIVFGPVDSAKETDVLIIGGGLAGVTAAYCLSKSGKRVILVEDGYLGSGETGRTTAHIAYALDDRYYDLERFFGKEKTKIIAESHRTAIDFIEDRVREEQIDCNFMRVHGHLFLDPTDKEKNLDEEFEATRRAGLPTEMLDDIPGFISDSIIERSIRFPDQGQFHILKYLKGLASAIIRNGGEIYTQSKATAISKTGAKMNGFAVSAKHIVVATNSPINDRFTMHTKQWPYRTYVIGAKIPKGTLPYAMWWDTGNQESKWVAKPYHYVRLEPFDEQFDLLISGGEDHKTGQADEEDMPEENRYASLIGWTKRHFPYFSDIAYQWSGQVMEPVDGPAFIGKNPGDDNIYIITGDSGNGMTHCTIGGILINDLISGIKNEWEDVYSPSRITFRTGDDYLKEVGNMTYKMAKDWLSSDIEKPSELKPGEGGIITKGLKKIAAYRDENGVLHSCSAVCPHLGGIVQWNNDEKSFDCPLHGSRFTADGTVINGPAGSGLKKADLEDE
ncbi:MAG TPA: FAD-dependent oxidoreductase [Flavobacterium sp.]|nr:FAD-dependent oxidoreductase [Flavobacterium sp.]